MSNQITRLYARKTKVKQLLVSEADSFFESNHTQKSLKKKQGSIVNLGLFYEDKLIAAAQWGPARTEKMNKEYSKELYRLSFLKNYRVVGGASKLIKHFIREYKPSDFFTYQDTTGEATSVYEKCGMTFVSQSAKKQYLVAPGKTLATASRQEALGMAYATRYGPDRITGSKLGEILREDGSRKTNKEIFIEDLGWHVEEAPGDRVYEWVDLSRTYYTYKISATDSPKCYFGVRHIKKANATIEDCLNDGYMGSGGVKFQNWRIAHSDLLIKEIVSIHFKRQAAYNREYLLINEMWEKDKENSLNIHLGSLYWDGNSISRPNSYSYKFCEVHGKTKHTKNGKCSKCSRGQSIKLAVCAIHGETTFSGSACTKCYTQKAVNEADCPIHGKAKHQGKTCSKCSAARFNTIKVCEIHGETSFKGNNCEKCTASKRVHTSICIIHGETRFQADKCYKCIQIDYEDGTCKIHGSVKLTAGGTCAKCRATKTFFLDNCDKHGETKFSKNNECRKCAAEARISVKECSKHGMVKHNLDSCYMCRKENRQRTLASKKK